MGEACVRVFELEAWLWMSLLWIAVVLALVSGAQYLMRAQTKVADGAIAKAL